jgi:hypothetical protein
MTYEPIRLFLWYKDGRAAGEFVMAPKEDRPTVIRVFRPTGSFEFWQDPREADMYREHV